MLQKITRIVLQTRPTLLSGDHIGLGTGASVATMPAPRRVLHTHSQAAQWPGALATPTTTRRLHEGGFVLVTTMALLLIAAFVALYSANTTLMETRMARIYQEGLEADNYTEAVVQAVLTASLFSTGNSNDPLRVGRVNDPLAQNPLNNGGAGLIDPLLNQRGIANWQNIIVTTRVVPPSGSGSGNQTIDRFEDIECPHLSADPNNPLSASSARFFRCRAYEIYSDFNQPNAERVEVRQGMLRLTLRPS